MRAPGLWGPSFEGHPRGAVCWLLCLGWVLRGRSPNQAAWSLFIGFTFQPAYGLPLLASTYSYYTNGSQDGRLSARVLGVLVGGVWGFISTYLVDPPLFRRVRVNTPGGLCFAETGLYSTLRAVPVLFVCVSVWYLLFVLFVCHIYL